MDKRIRMGVVAEKTLRAIMMAVFLPVLLCVLFVGNNMNYYEGFKLETVRSNGFLFMVAAFVMVLSVFLIHVCNKIPLNKTGNRIANLLLILLCVGVYFLSVRIAREIAFFLPWDITIVSGAASEYVAKEIPIGYFYYLSIYINNIPITYILGRLLYHAKNTFDYSLHPQFIWLQANCILMTASIFFSTLTIKRLTKNIMLIIVAFLLNFSLIGLSAWKIAPYTDTYAQLFPILSIYFYICYRQSVREWKKVILISLSIISCVVGGFIKPSVYLILIAIVAAEIIYCLLKEKTKWQYPVLEIAVIIGMLIAAGAYQSVIVDRIGLDKNDNIEGGAVEYFYMGLNEETTGAYNGKDVAVYVEFQYTEREERDAVVLQRAFDRIKERGFAGMLYFWLRKMVMVFNDASFGWATEVWVQGYYSPPVSTDTQCTEFLRKIYWKGPYTGAYQTLEQLVWIYCLLGIVGICFSRRKEKNSVILILSFLGCFFYQMLFEARARYLFVFLPFLLVCATYGMYQYSFLWRKLVEWRGLHWKKRVQECSVSTVGKQMEELNERAVTVFRHF